MLNSEEYAVKHTTTRGALALVLATSVMATAFAVPEAAAAETGLTLAVLQSGSQKTVDTTVAGITRTTYTGGAGPWNVNVMVIDPDKAPLTLKGTFGTGLATSQTTSAMLQGVSVNALRQPRVGVNGSFFDGNINNPASNSNDGDVSGILVRGGKLLSEASRGKGTNPVGSSLVLQHGRAYITELSTTMTVKPKNSAIAPRKLDGINRVPGRNAHCEGVTPNDPDEVIVDSVCLDSSEIISFTPEYAAPTPSTAFSVAANDPDVPGAPVQDAISTDEGIELILDARNTVSACYDSAPAPSSTCQKGNRGGRTVPPNGRILQGIGQDAAWLRTNAPAGTELELPETVTDTRFGDTIALDPSMYVTAGGDLLLRDGAITYTQPATNSDGSAYTPDAAPRTAVGTDGYGRTVLVTVDGRRTTISKGATRREMATLLKDLGVIDALNMDGGGSTTLVWQNAVANHPSDGTDTEKERPIGDAVYAGAGGYPLP